MCVFVLIITGNFYHIYGMPPDPLDKAALNKRSVREKKVEVRRITPKEKVMMKQLKNDIDKLQKLQNDMQNDMYVTDRIKDPKNQNAKQFVTHLKSSKTIKVMRDLQGLVDDVLYCAENSKDYKTNLRCKDLSGRINKAEKDLTSVRNKNDDYIKKLVRDYKGNNIRNKRQEFQTMFENFDQKANQLFNILSTVLKSVKEMESAVTRNLL